MIHFTFDGTAVKGTQHGFNHETTLIVTEEDGTFKKAHAVCHYINRTWEPYTFYSVKMAALYNLIADETDKICAQYKREHECSRLPRGYRDQVKKELEHKYIDIQKYLRDA